MIRFRHTRRLALASAVLVLAGLASLHGQKPADDARRIAVFGSSVAFGTGDDLGKEGYTGRLRELLAPRGWDVLNQSHGGDNTKTMAPRFQPEGEPDPKVRYLLPVNPNYVLLGLSLGNEGIQNGKTAAEKDAIFAQFESGMRGFVDRSRLHHIVPIVTLCYARNDFTSVEYSYTRRMNRVINSWDVPSVNFLGAVDDGTGKWAKGFWHDALHPNAAGHSELVRTFVPSLFEAIEKGKPIPKLSESMSSTHLAADSLVAFSPDDSMHPFALVFAVRVPSAKGTPADGTLASITGSTLTLASEPKREERGGGRGAIEFEASTLTPGPSFKETVSVRRGVLALTSANGTVVASAVKADTEWHRVVVSHYTARGETLFYVDGALAGKVSERLEPKRFTLGGAPADVRGLMIYRSALNDDEVAAIENGTMLQASLEVYSPLDDEKVEKGGAFANRAQSLTSAKLEASPASGTRSQGKR